MNKYSIAMITYDDMDTIQNTLDNVRPYIVSDFVIVDGGSTDGTLETLKKFRDKVGEDKVLLLETKWNHDFEVQKNFALDNTKEEWRVLIDADEKLEHLLWNHDVQHRPPLLGEHSKAPACDDGGEGKCESVDLLTAGSRGDANGPSARGRALHGRSGHDLPVDGRPSESRRQC